MSIYRVYAEVADLSEGTLSPDHALDIAEWIVRERPTLRQRFQRLMWGRSYDEVAAQAMREKWRRDEWVAGLYTCGMADRERTGHPEREDADTDGGDSVTSESCDHEWEVEYLPDPMSAGSVVRSGALRCPKCFASLEDA